MAILLGIDLETTGLDPEKDKIIEVGAALWDTERNQVLMTMSSLVCHIDEGFDLSPEIRELTGIHPEYLYQFGRPLEGILEGLASVIGEHVDYLVAHNADFEQGFLYTNGGGDIVASCHWIDTMVDIPTHTGKSLTHMAADHGFLNSFPHRALFDVMTMFKILACHEFWAIEHYSKAPKVTLIAQVSYDERGVVKEHGYQWNNIVPGKWAKRVPDFQVEEEIQMAKELFPVFIAEPEGGKVIAACH